MSYGSLYELKLPDDYKVQFNQDITFENFIAQFQPFCDKLLCIINGTTLRFYDKTNKFPDNLRYDHKQRRGSLTEYCFRDIDNDNIYCIFGRENAMIFYPNINQVDPLKKENLINKPQENLINKPQESLITKSQEQLLHQESLNRNVIVIFYKGKKIIFSEYDHEDEIKTFC